MFDFSIFRVRRQQAPKELRVGGALLVVLGLFIGAGATLLGWALLRIMIVIAVLFVVAGVGASVMLGRPIGRVGQ